MKNCIKQAKCMHNFRFILVNSDPVSVYHILIVYLWFVLKKTMEMSVSGPIVIEKASQFHAKWLWWFWNSHGIRQLSLQGEKLTADALATEPFKNTLLEYIEK